MATIYHVYCDESCTDKGHSHMVLAGLMTTADDALSFRNHMRAWRIEANMRRELKWQRVTNDKSRQYQEYISTGLDHIQKRAFAFRSIVIKKRDIDYDRFHEGDKEKAFRRFVYTLVYHCFCPRMQDDDQLALFLDQRDGTPLEELRTILNRALCRHRPFQCDPIRSAQWIDSKASELMQLNDVLMGAVGCHNNGRHLLADTRQSKKDLAATIARSAGLTDLCAGTSPESTHFGIWHLKLAPKKKAS